MKNSRDKKYKSKATGIFNSGNLWLGTSGIAKLGDINPRSSKFTGVGVKLRRFQQKLEHDTTAFHSLSLSLPLFNRLYFLHFSFRSSSSPKYSFTYSSSFLGLLTITIHTQSMPFINFSSQYFFFPIFFFLCLLHTYVREIRT